MIENEAKYVLRLDAADHIEGYPEFLNPPSKTLIDQHYHGNGGRLRRTDGANGPEYTFNYKIDLPNGEMEEFEHSITSDSYFRGVLQCDAGLRKIRYTMPTTVMGFLETLVRWDVDYFLSPTSGLVYFVIAECEMPTGVEFPASLPPYIEKFLLHRVDRSDNRFTSKKLCDQYYAQNLLEKLGHD